MGFFDDIGNVFTGIAEDVFKCVNTATEAVFDANKQVLSGLGVDKDSFANQVLDQWQQQQRVALGTMFKVVGDGLNVVTTGASAVEKGLDQYLGIQNPLGPIAQLVQMQTAQALHQIGVNAENVDKAGELALSAIVDAVKNAGAQAEGAVLNTVNNMISGDAKLQDLIQSTQRAQAS